MSIQTDDEPSPAEQKRWAEQIAANWEDTPFEEMAEAFLDDLEERGDG